MNGIIHLFYSYRKHKKGWELGTWRHKVRLVGGEWKRPQPIQKPLLPRLFYNSFFSFCSVSLSFLSLCPPLLHHTHFQLNACQNIVVTKRQFHSCWSEPPLDLKLHYSFPALKVDMHTQTHYSREKCKDSRWALSVELHYNGVDMQSGQALSVVVW